MIVLPDLHLNADLVLPLKFKALEQFLEELPENTKVVFAGDVFHLKERTPLSVIDQFCGLLKRFPSLRFYILPGQHDLRADGQFIAPQIFKLSHVQVVQHPLEVDNWLLLPFQRDPSRWLDLYPPYKRIITHQPLQEALGTTNKAYLTIRQLPPDLVVLSGDIHRGGSFQAPTWIYLGCFGPSSWADTNFVANYAEVTPDGSFQINPLPFIDWAFVSLYPSPFLPQLQAKRLFVQVKADDTTLARRFLDRLRERYDVVSYQLVAKPKPVQPQAIRLEELSPFSVIQQVATKARERFPAEELMLAEEALREVLDA